MRVWRYVTVDRAPFREGALSPHEREAIAVLLGGRRERERPGCSVSRWASSAGMSKSDWSRCRQPWSSISASGTKPVTIRGGDRSLKR